MVFSLANQVALVIGASSGIGRATAVSFARHGTKVLASARRKDRLAQLEAEMTREGNTLAVEAADASDPAAMERLAERAHKEFGKVDILVYATGTNTPDRTMRRLRPELWNELVSVNLNG